MATAWDTITIDDLPNEDLQWIARSFGIDVARAIWKRFAGNGVQCPSGLSQQAAMRYMRDHFDKPVHQLAVGLGRSTRTIYRYMNIKPSTDKRQVSLF